jgi:predicted acylesterase/phospholipase RssA
MSQRRDPEAGLRFNRGPTRAIPGEAGPDALRDGIALCLSGGGYRAMLFHLGGLWRLNELGLLLDRVSAVSGGALTASALAVAWGELDFGDAGVARAFAARVVGPVRSLASRTLDRGAILLGLLLPGGTNSRLAAAYRRYLLGSRVLADLPERPEFVFTATDVLTGSLWCSTTSGSNRRSSATARSWSATRERTSPTSPGRRAPGARR